MVNAVRTFMRAACVFSINALVGATFNGQVLFDENGVSELGAEIMRLGEINAVARTLIEQGLLTDDVLRARAQAPPAVGVARGSAEHIRSVSEALEELVDATATAERDELIRTLMADFEFVSRSHATSQEDLVTISHLLHRYMLDKRLGTLRKLRPVVSEIVARVENVLFGYPLGAAAGVSPEATTAVATETVSAMAPADSADATAPAVSADDTTTSV